MEYYTTKFYYDSEAITGTNSGYDHTFSMSGQHWLLENVQINANGVYSGFLYLTHICNVSTGYNVTYSYEMTGNITLSGLNVYGDKFDQIKIWHSGDCQEDGTWYTRLAAKTGS